MCCYSMTTLLYSTLLYSTLLYSTLLYTLLCYSLQYYDYGLIYSSAQPRSDGSAQTRRGTAPGGLRSKPRNSGVPQEWLL